MAHFLKRLEQIIRSAVFVVAAAMLVVVIIQVLARTFLTQSPSWTEEVSGFVLLYMVGLGVGLSILSGDLVNVDLALMIMPKGLRRFCERLSALLVSAFGFVLIFPSWEYTQLGAISTAPTLPDLSMNFIFVTMVFFSVMLAFYGLVKFIKISFLEEAL